MVYEKDGEVHIMIHKPDGRYFSLRDEKYYKTLEGFEDKYDDIMDKTDSLNE